MVLIIFYSTFAHFVIEWFFGKGHTSKIRRKMVEMKWFLPICVAAICLVGCAETNETSSSIKSSVNVSASTSSNSPSPQTSSTPKPVIESTPKPSKAETETASQRNAIRKAKDYLSIMSFSKKGLIEQLEFDGYPSADAQYAADHIDVNWDEQAEKKAKEYLEVMSFSKQELKEQLEFDGFTSEQAAYGVNKAYQ